MINPEYSSALLSSYSHSIVNKTFLSFIFNGLFSC
ncbi:phenol hydroxylase component domain protein [Vibrio cholerae]|nr:phenol hydroxylase component domain protein [Vibrio cholerae]